MEIKPTQASAELATRSLTQIGALNELRGIQDKRAQAEQVATQFEAVFMEMMMKSMRETIPQDGLMSGGSGEQTYTAMLDQHMLQMGGTTFDPRFHQRLVESILDQSGTPEEAIGRSAEKRARAEAGEALEFQSAELKGVFKP